MGPVGVQEMLVIFIVALVLFGPKKLPELGRTLGKAITEFRRAQNELKSTFEHHMKELEQENESIKEVTRSFTSDLYNSYEPSYSGSYNPEPYESSPEPVTPSHPSTVGEPATQGAESAVSHETSVNGTVPRTAPTLPAEPKAEPAAPHAEPLPESSSVNS